MLIVSLTCYEFSSGDQKRFLLSPLGLTLKLRRKSLWMGCLGKLRILIIANDNHLCGMGRIKAWTKLNLTFPHLSPTGVSGTLGVCLYPSQQLSDSFAAIAISVSITDVMIKRCGVELTTEAMKHIRINTEIY